MAMDPLKWTSRIVDQVDRPVVYQHVQFVLYDVVVAVVLEKLPYAHSAIRAASSNVHAALVVTLGALRGLFAQNERVARQAGHVTPVQIDVLNNGRIVLKRVGN